MMVIILFSLMMEEKYCFKQHLVKYVDLQLEIVLIESREKCLLSILKIDFIQLLAFKMNPEFFQKINGKKMI